MPLMSSIRKNLAKMFAVLAFLFVLMIVFEWGMDLSGSGTGVFGAKGDVIGVVNGNEISYKRFAEMVRQASESRKSQTGQEPDGETERLLRSQIWNQTIDDILMTAEIERLGIVVTDQEIRDIVNSPNPPDFLVSQFRDSLGVFQRQAYQEAMMNPQNRQAWLQVEDLLREQQKRQKLQSLMLATVQASESEVWRRYEDRNLTLEAQYVLFDPTRLVPDTAVHVSDEDLRSVYEERPEDFKSRETRRVQYVSFNLLPTREDTLLVEDDMKHIATQVQSGVSFEELAQTFSEKPQTDAYFRHGELSKEKESAIFAARKGDIVGPVYDADGAHLFRIVDDRQGTTEYVNAAHILLRHGTGPDSVRVIREIQELARRAKAGEDFAALARERSEDGSAQAGGELGWTAREGWVKPFADAAFGARVGQVVGPVRSQFGWHVIKVLGKDRREVKLSTVTMQVKAGSQTIDAAYRNAEDFAYLARQEGYEKGAELNNFSVQETPEFTRDGFVPGIGQQDIVTAFAFSNDEGEISDPITLTGSVAVFRVSKVRPEGVRPYDEVLAQLRSIAYREKRLSLVKEQADAFHASLPADGDIIGAARSNPLLTAASTGPFKPADGPTSVGRDPRFIGTCMATGVGELSAPFEGTRGYYIVKMLTRSVVDTSAYAVSRESLRSQILQEKQNRLLSEWQRSLRDKADIEDYRYRFYR